MGAKCCTERKPRPRGWDDKPFPSKMTTSLRHAWAEGLSGCILYEVFLEKEDEPIGFELETDTSALTVKAVTPDGLLDRYCKQEDEFVCPGDRIYSVNDFTDKSDMMRQLKEQQKLEIVFSKLIIEVKILKRPGKKLGAATDPKTFTILKIAEESLIDDWNKQYPKDRICIGDTVLAVNGVVDKDKAVQEIASKEELLLRMVRGPRREMEGVKDTKSTAMSLEPCGRLRICKFAHFVQRMGKENHQHLKSRP
ncbi:unnamed protein product [Durusdinium trenchii]|uniref:PDZ domain-containing protein n=1 Tax=Durusdinium trenchii TaxID=1381693 RepID=A0ABP0NGA2_9DINO